MKNYSKIRFRCVLQDSRLDWSQIIIFCVTAAERTLGKGLISFPNIIFIFIRFKSIHNYTVRE